MASPILHIKDAYYFEVPKRICEYKYKDLDELPKSWEFLKTGHPHATVQEINHEMSGKILIPQPFGELKNLYEKKSGFCISKFMVVEVTVAILLTVVMVYVAGKIRSGAVPRGKFVNFFEAILLFIRDSIARPAIGAGHDDSHGHGGGHGHESGHGHGDAHGHGVGHGHAGGHAHGPDYRDADKFVPLLWTLFFFILACNLFGLLPWAGSPTGSFSVTLALAAVTLATTIISGTMKFGPVGFWLNQVPSMDLPVYMRPVKVMIWVIEVIGLLIKHAVLAVRLLANMLAGHLVLLGILGLAFSAEMALHWAWPFVAFPVLLGSTIFSCLELFVAFLQAYIFTFLSALFIGAAVHQH